MKNITMVQQWEIAEKVGITQPAVHYHLTGKKVPTLKIALQYKRHFGIPLDVWEDVRGYLAELTAKNKAQQGESGAKAKKDKATAKSKKSERAKSKTDGAKTPEKTRRQQANKNKAQA